MIDLEDLHKTWFIISKNKYMKTDAQVINFFRAIQQEKNIVKDAQDKAFGGIIDKNY